MSHTVHESRLLDFKGQYIAADNSEWLRQLDERYKQEFPNGKYDFDENPLADAIGVSEYIKRELNKWKQKDLKLVWGTVDVLSATLLDLYPLVDSKYLLGAYYSTLSLNACYLRGLDRIYGGSIDVKVFNA